MLPLTSSGGSFSSLGWFHHMYSCSFWRFLSVVFSLLWFSMNTDHLDLSELSNSTSSTQSLGGSTWVGLPELKPRVSLKSVNWGNCRVYLFISHGFILKIFIYLFMKDERHRERERGRDIGRGRSRLPPGRVMWDPRITPWAEGRCSTTEPLRCPHFPCLKNHLQGSENHCFIYFVYFWLLFLKGD